MNVKIQSIYETLTKIRLILNREIKGTKEEVITNILGLNEALWEVRDDITCIIKKLVLPPYKSRWKDWVIVVSILINVILIVLSYNMYFYMRFYLIEIL
ncbi:hypothetical protein COI49_15865 [Bacillus toyonensis]|nr:hypothetical protein COI49_15865 [Bacillus toyonensis]